MASRKTKIINVACAIAGVALLSFGTWGIYFSTHMFYLCITNPNNTNLPNCLATANEDFPYVILQIMGIFIPIFAMVWTTNFKKND